MNTNKFNEPMKSYIEDWYSKYPSYYPIVRKFMEDELNMGKSTIYNFTSKFNIKCETESNHHIRIKMEELLKSTSKDDFLWKKKCCPDELSVNDQTKLRKVNNFLEKNPLYEERRVKHNNIVKTNRELNYKDYHNQWYKDNIDKVREYNKKNREKINEYYRNYYHDETTGYKVKHLNLTEEQKKKRDRRRKEYYWKNPEKYRKLGREYYHKTKHKTKDIRKKRSRESYWKNPEYYRRKSIEYYWKNKGKNKRKDQ